MREVKRVPDVVVEPVVCWQVVPPPPPFGS
jgi:hypothetical protein